MTRSDWIGWGLTLIAVPLGIILGPRWAIVPGVIGIAFLVKGFLTRPTPQPVVLPEIRGEAFDFRAGMYGSSMKGYQKSVHSDVIFRLFLCNHAPTSTTLKEVLLDGSALHPGLAFTLVSWSEGVELPYGTGKTVDVQATATTYDKHAGELGPVSLDALKVRVVDALDNGYPIATRLGERLLFGNRG